MSLTPQQFEDILKQAPDEFAKIFNNAPFVAVLDLNGAIQQRIFNNGEDSNGSAIGNYKSLPYKKKRESKGRQTNYVDLEFTGDLRRSIVTGKEENKATVRINNSDEQNIAGFLTERYNKPIFQPSEKESSEAKEKMINFIQEEIKNLIATWR